MNQKIIFLDVETTGGSPSGDRVIEIGAVVWDNGEVKEWQSLINPEVHIPEEIVMLTGILPQNLDRAPTFSMIARELSELMEGGVFVAHNARFDYAFLKNEFWRLGMDFSIPVVCSLKLSRKLWASEKKHSLDALMERFGIECENRHRALDDAKVIADFFVKAEEILGKEKWEESFSGEIVKQSEPPLLSRSSLLGLHEGCGVYIFYGQNSEVLYVGKSKRVKDRVWSHFYADVENDREMALKQNVTRIEVRETLDELEALMLESMLVKKMRPIYNRKLRALEKVSCIKLDPKKGITTYEVSVYEVDEILKSDAVFRNKLAMKKFLESMREIGFCAKLLSLEKGKGPCFSYHLGNCTGVCAGKKRIEIEVGRLALQMARARMDNWPFEGPVRINDGGMIVDRWCIAGKVNGEGEIETGEVVFDLDIYRLLRQKVYQARVTPWK